MFRSWLPSTQVSPNPECRGFVECAWARSTTPSAPAMLAQWAQQKNQPSASTPWPIAFTPQYSQPGGERVDGALEDVTGVRISPRHTDVERLKVDGAASIACSVK